MKTFLLLILSAIFYLSSNAQIKDVLFSELVISSDVFYYNDKQYTGMAKEYKDGKLMKRADINSGRFHGQYLEFYENGRVKIRTHYIEGIKEGKETHFYPNLKVPKMDCYFVQGKKQGLAKYWNRHYQLMKIEDFNEDTLVSTIVNEVTPFENLVSGKYSMDVYYVQTGRGLSTLTLREDSTYIASLSVNRETHVADSGVWTVSGYKVILIPKVKSRSLKEKKLIKHSVYENWLEQREYLFIRQDRLKDFNEKESWGKVPE